MFPTEPSLEVLVIAGYPDRAHKCHMSKLSQPRRMNYHTAWWHRGTLQNAQNQLTCFLQNQWWYFHLPQQKDYRTTFIISKKATPEHNWKRTPKLSADQILFTDPHKITTVTRRTSSDKQNSDWNTETPENTSYGLWIHVIIKDCYS